MADEKRSVVVVDDQTAFAEAIRDVLSMTDDLVCVDTATSHESLAALDEQYEPDLFVVAYRAGARSGLVAARELRSHRVNTPVLLLTSTPAAAVAKASEDVVHLAVTSKWRSVASLIENMRLVLEGRTVEDEDASVMATSLSRREMSVLLLLSEGCRASGIASDLGLSIHTVRDHIKEILSKLGADTQLRAVLEAQRLGLVPVVA